MKVHPPGERSDSKRHGHRYQASIGADAVGFESVRRDLRRRPGRAQWVPDRSRGLEFQLRVAPLLAALMVFVGVWLFARIKVHRRRDRSRRTHGQ